VNDQETLNMLAVVLFEILNGSLTYCRDAEGRKAAGLTKGRIVEGRMVVQGVSMIP
jgi:hypothetical protein